ncbi:MAG: TIGR03960 family B12-binding radical SAM protein, partial [Desulfovibrio sp.]|nr:TIGR03960 family B12-binding radical SAM protein [Desulfovibrio sp.]
LDCVGFSITHELCYTNVLYMLDLAQIPLRSANRPDNLQQCPLIIAGGGALLGAEPLTPFMDLMVLGDGEEVFPKLLKLLEAEKKQSHSRKHFLQQAQDIAGIYVPGFFMEKEGVLQNIFDKTIRPTRTIVHDLDTTAYPTSQVVPIGAVHNRLSVEIARGCTRGCRFCQAGMVYRPVRERTPQTINHILQGCLDETGFEEISFLALSTGDYSALKTLSEATLHLCHNNQISFSLPSQRVGSIDDSIIAQLADLRRTGMTLAPEAGSQRLRDVINKGITEEEIILHAQKRVEHGWRNVKLYFMIGLPQETDEDLLAIVDLCCKVRGAAGKGNPKLAVTAAISPFVPKPFTPFQWVEQIDLDEIKRRIQFLRTQIHNKKGITLRWHEPSVSHLEGILSRAGRELADVVERAYQKGALFCNWMEHFSLEPWLEALQEAGFTAADFIGKKSLQAPLPWDHLEAGVSKDFLKREWAKAQKAQVTSDCRFTYCHGCGVCDTPLAPSRLRRKDEDPYKNHLVFAQRDQASHAPHFDEQGKLLLKQTQSQPEINAELIQKVVQYRIWHTKRLGSCYLSQLELQ